MYTGIVSQKAIDQAEIQALRYNRESVEDAALEYVIEQWQTGDWDSLESLQYHAWNMKHRVSAQIVTFDDVAKQWARMFTEEELSVSEFVGLTYFRIMVANSNNIS